FGDLVFDPVRRVHVLADYATTMTYDGLAWTQHGGVPFGTTQAACFVPFRGHVMTLANQNTPPSPGTLAFEFSGSNWLICPTLPTGLASSVQPVMAFDQARNVLVVVAGDPSNNTISTTWTWNGSQWAQLSSSGVFGFPRFMAYDVGRQRTVLSSRWTPSAFGTWEWDGSSWSAITITTLPTGTGAMTYDEQRGRVVMFDNGLWEWDGISWQPRSAAPVPGNGISHHLSFDSARGTNVLVNGSTWELWSNVVVV